MKEQIPLRGAVDLAALAKAREMANQPKSAFVVDATDRNFEQLVINKSKEVPVLIDLWAEWCGPCKQLSPVLENLAAQANGAWILAKVDVDHNPQLAQAFQVQSIPAVFLAMAGQISALFTGAQPESAIKEVLVQVLQVAKEQGLAPSLNADTPMITEPEDPADDLILNGDLAGAKKLYEDRLLANPKDQTAKLGLSNVSFLSRTLGQDLKNVALAAVDDIDNRLKFADAQMLIGDFKAAFDCLLESIRQANPDNKEVLKERLLELFDLIEPEHPQLLAARRALASALF